MHGFFSFPDPVNDKAARTVAAVVLLGVLVTLASSWYWLLIPLAYGFWARVLTGPRLSPLGWVAMNVIGPRLGAKHYVPGPPKRFAQGMGVATSSLALVFGLILGDRVVTDALLGLFAVASGLESIFGYCIGCRAFAILMRLGVIPESACPECADISRRLGVARG